MLHVLAIIDYEKGVTDGIEMIISLTLVIVRYAMQTVFLIVMVCKQTSLRNELRHDIIRLRSKDCSTIIPTISIAGKYNSTNVE